MKKVLLLVLLVVVLSVSSVFAVQKGTSVTVNPLGWLMGMYNVEVNMSVAPNLSVPVSFSYWSFDDDDGADEWDVSITGLGTGLRYYFAKEAVNGWYLGGLLNFNIISVDLKTTDSSYPYAKLSGQGDATAIGIGGLIGYQGIWENGVTLDFGLGVQSVTIPSIKVTAKGSGLTQTEEYDGTSLTLPVLKLALGFAF